MTRVQSSAEHLNYSIALVYATVVLAPLVALLTWIHLTSRRPKNFPPGPPTVPLLGNLHLLPTSKAFIKFHEFAQTYGDIVGLKFGAQNVVVLNSHRHVRELFDKRSVKYSDRPHTYVANELVVPNEVNILFQPYGAAWRKSRKMCQSFLNNAATDQLLPLQNAEVTQTVQQIIDDPEGFFNHIRRYSTAVILASIYGQRGRDFNDPKISRLYHTQDRYTTILAPGSTPPVDLLPFLRHLPGAWKREAKEVRRLQSSLYKSLADETKARLQAGKATGCFIEQLLRDQEKLELDDEHLAYMGGIMMEAGSDTTTSTVLSFILALLCHPEILKKAQEEIDAVVGSDRSPGPDDIRKLPYIEACMLETLRWRPVAPGGIPHRLAENDTYGQYHFPKGTLFFANAWSIHRDEQEYENPDEFDPGRFMRSKFGTRHDAQAKSGEDDNRRVTYAFGASRRVCQGQRMAENSLLLNMSKLMWAFDISPAEGETQLPRDYVDDVQKAYTDGFVFAPRPFRAKFTVRTPGHREIIERENKLAQEMLAKYE